MKIDAGIGESRVTFFQLVILILSVLVLGALVADIFVPLPREAARLLNVLDTIVCAVFLGEFCVRFYHAESKRRFMKWGWIDLLASIPNVEVLRWGRLIRLLQIIRLLRGIRSLQKIAALVFKEKLKTGISSVLLTTFLLIFFSALAILLCERTPESNIKTAEDAIWWTVSTITTVGYGDRFPVTTEGRVVAMVLMFGGVGLFGVLSGIIASYFVGSRELKAEEDIVLAELQKLHRKIDQLEKTKQAESTDRAS